MNIMVILSFQKKQTASIESGGTILFAELEKGKEKENKLCKTFLKCFLKETKKESYGQFGPPGRGSNHCYSSMFRIKWAIIYIRHSRYVFKGSPPSHRIIAV